MDNTLRKASQGDSKCFMALVEQKKDMLYKIALSYAKNHEDALDIVQETVMKAFISVKSLKEPQYFHTWLTKILINSAYSHVKKQQKYLPLTIESGEYDSGINEDYIDLSIALDRLEEKERMLILLKFFEDMTFSEISDVLSIPESTVKSKYYKALNKIEKILK